MERSPEMSTAAPQPFSTPEKASHTPVSTPQQTEVITFEKENPNRMELDGSQTENKRRNAPSSSPPIVPHYMPAHSFEFIFFVSTSVLINLAGFVYFYRWGKRLAPAIRPATGFLEPPLFPFSYLGSIAVDTADLQWSVFFKTLKIVIPLFFLFVWVGKIVRLYALTNTVPFCADVVHTVSTQNGASSCSESSSTSNGSREATPFTESNDDSYGRKGNKITHVKRKQPFNLRKLVQWLFTTPKPHTARLRPLFLYHIIAGFLMIFFVSGPKLLFEMVLLLINYFVIRPLPFARFPFAVCMAVMWSFMVGSLFANHYFHGYRFSWLGLSSLDSFPAMIAWTVHYNMAVLRMIAFNNDCWEAHQKNAEERRKEVYAKHQKVCVDCALLKEDAAEVQQELHSTLDSLPEKTLEARMLFPTSSASATREFLSCYKCRSESPRATSQYTLLGYLAYVFYPPLFLAGPMISYNAYVSFVSRPAQTFPRRKKIQYGLRVLGNLVFLVGFMHYFFLPTFLFTRVNIKQAANLGFFPPTGAERAAAEARAHQDPTMTIAVMDLMSIEEKGYLLYVALAFLWCKFNVIWKFFRFFAILDGLDPPEDMPHCFSNTVSITDFWQCWHASFNLWIVRYMYIPMGGAKKKLLTLVPIFLFIAIWHDIELRLLHWALFMCACFVPEIAITTFFQKTKWRPIASLRQRPVAWRRVKEVGATFGEWALILANLIGFSTGSSAVTEQVTSMFDEGVSKLFLALFLLFYIGTGKISVRYREVQAYKLQCTKQRLGMS